VDATEEALAAGFWKVLVAEMVGGARGLSLDGEGAAARLGEGVGTGARPPIEVGLLINYNVAYPFAIPDNILLHF
jgi:hypothetical protein